MLSSELQGTSRMKWRRQWHPTPVLLPGKSHWWRSLVGCSPWVTKSRTRLSNFTLTFLFHALEMAMAPHSSTLAWKIPWMEEPGGLPSMGSHRVGHDWSDSAAAAAAAVGWERKFETECLLQILCKPCIVSQVDVKVILQWSAKNVLELDIGGMCTAWYALIVTELFNLKWLTLCYVNFNSIKKIFCPCW